MTLTGNVDGRKTRRSPSTTMNDQPDSARLMQLDPP
jgi:hypothetical protein